MTVAFTEYRGQKIRSNQIRAMITTILQSLGNVYSYHSNLQMIYNNEEHFTTVPFRVCNIEDLQRLAYAAYSNNETVVVQGTIHQNFHASGVVLNAKTHERMPVYDTYIRAFYNGTTIHILIEPPSVASPQPYILRAVTSCHQPLHIIYPKNQTNANTF